MFTHKADLDIDCSSPDLFSTTRSEENRSSYPKRCSWLAVPLIVMVFIFVPDMLGGGASQAFDSKPVNQAQAMHGGCPPDFSLAKLFGSAR